MKKLAIVLGVMVTCLGIYCSRVSAEIITFQNQTYIGTEKYVGSFDAYPREYSTVTNGSFNGYNTMYVRTTGSGIANSSLIEWAGIQNYLPTDFEVQSARIGLFVQQAFHNFDIGIAQMLKIWNGPTLNWLADGMGNSWAAAGAQGITANGTISADRAATNLDTVNTAGYAAGSIIWFDVTASVVQGWIDNPSSNYGVIVYGSNPAEAGSLIALSGVAEGLINGVNQRPILEITGSVVPEPTTLVLLCTGIACLVRSSRKCR